MATEFVAVQELREAYAMSASKKQPTCTTCGRTLHVDSSIAAKQCVPCGLADLGHEISDDPIEAIAAPTPTPAAEKPPVVMPAPKISAPVAVVVTVPLFADVLLPEAEVPTSNGLTGSRPLYSRARMSTNGVDALKATVTVFVPAAAVFLFLA